MSLRHNHRRRLLSDEGSDDESEDRSAVRLARADEAAPGEGLLSYSNAAEQARHRALHSLFPARLLTIGLTLATGVLLIGLCLGLHWVSEPLAQVLPPTELTALRLDSPRGLSHWLAGTVMGLTGAVGAFIYALRRHRTDDYHGRYRVWLWASLLAVVTGVCETTSLGDLTRATIGLAAERSNVEAAYALPLIAATVALAAGVRLLIEIRQAPLAVTSLILACVSFGVGLATSAGWPQPILAEYRPWATRGCTLLGYWLVLTAALAYCRHVQQAIVGKQAVVARPKKSKKIVASVELKEAPTKSSSLKIRTDLDAPEPAEAPRSSHSAAPASNSVNKSASSPLGGHMSRAERRKARRMAG